MKQNSKIIDANAADLQALAQIKEGNANAFNAIWKRYHPFVYQKAFAMLKSHDDAEDAVQDTFLKVYEKLLEGKFEDKGITFNAWISAVYTHALLDVIRKKKIAVVSLSNTDDEQFSEVESALLEISQSVHYDDELNVIKNKKYELLDKLLESKLSEEEKQIVVLSFEKFTQEEIGAKIGQTRFYVNTKLSRIRKRISGIIETFNQEETFNFA